MDSGPTEAEYKAHLAAQVSQAEDRVARARQSIIDATKALNRANEEALEADLALTTARTNAAR